MLVIISDLHLTDGTSGTTINADAFNIFRERLRGLARAASDRKVNDKEFYQPIEEIHLLLLGDILDVIRSSRWLQNDVRPWDNATSEVFINKVREITDAIRDNNQQALGVFHGLKHQGIEIPANKPDTGEKATVRVFIYYMVGNHDWFYHLPGSEFNQIRLDIIETLGLANDPSEVFPHDTKESTTILDVCRRHNVFARHGDIFDTDNYEPSDRNKSSLGDAVVIELVDRFAFEVEQQLKHKIAEGRTDVWEGLREIDNVRPVYLVPKWVDGLLKRNADAKEVTDQVREIWNRVVNDFLKIKFVKRHRSTLKWGLRLFEGMSFRDLGKIIPWGENLLTSFGSIFPRFNKLLCRWGLSDSYYPYALGEKSFHQEEISYIVYGHTHRHEIVPLRTGKASDGNQSVVYINSGTWRAVYEQDRYRPKDEEFFGYHVMTYLAFFENDERKGKAFETWSGSLEYPMMGSVP
jgi:UDP-2,3-diacylglucosamine pyrophosphatase LpxH